MESKFEPVEIEVEKIVIVEHDPNLWPRLEFITKGGARYCFYSVPDEDGMASVWLRPKEKKEIKNPNIIGKQ